MCNPEIAEITAVAPSNLGNKRSLLVTYRVSVIPVFLSEEDMNYTCCMYKLAFLLQERAFGLEAYLSTL